MKSHGCPKCERAVEGVRTFSDGSVLVRHGGGRECFVRAYEMAGGSVGGVSTPSRRWLDVLAEESGVDLAAVVAR